MAGLSDRERILLIKALDGELSGEEQRAFTRLLETNQSLQDEWQALKNDKEVTMTMKFKEPSGETWDRYWAGVYARMERGLAWLLISIGGALVLGVALYQAFLEFMNDTATPFYLKIALGVLALGCAILVVSVVREKWSLWKTDKYKGVIR